MLIYPSVTGTAPQLGIYLRVQLKQMWFNNIKQWESHSLSLSSYQQNLSQWTDVGNTNNGNVGTSLKWCDDN